MNRLIGIIALLLTVGLFAQSEASAKTSQDTILSALMGAGTGAIAAEASGGKAGQGALVGMGTNVIGGVLIDFLTTPSQPSAYAPAYTEQPVYSTQVSAPATYQQPTQQMPAYTYAPATSVISTNGVSPQANYSKQIIGQGLMGAATGAIASEVSDGNAGEGALVGAGTHIIGSALIDILLQPSQSVHTAYPTPIARATNRYYQHNPSPYQERRIVRTYDGEGNLVKEEEFYN